MPGVVMEVSLVCPMPGPGVGLPSPARTRLAAPRVPGSRAVYRVTFSSKGRLRLLSPCPLPAALSL